MDQDSFEIFCVTAPGMEDLLADEARALGFADATPVPGGVEMRGGRDTVMRANLWLRGAVRVLMRVGDFRAFHLAQLDKRARKFPWGEMLRRDVPVRVESVCRKSKIYHAGAATQRIETAIAESLGAPIGEGGVRVLVRIDDNLVTISVDTSGEPLHKRGFKEAVGKAPMRESLAALFLRGCGFDGGEPVLDPMCGSGTFPIEAAEIAAGLAPGRARRFAFEDMAGFDAEAWAAMKGAAGRDVPDGPVGFYGSDRDAGAIRGAGDNAARAGVAALCRFDLRPVSDIAPPDGPPGLVIVNPPYGARIGNKKLLFALHASLGRVLRDRFAGWRVGIITSDGALAKSTDLPLLPPGPPVAHGGLKVRLYRTDILG